MAASKLKMVCTAAVAISASLASATQAANWNLGRTLTAEELAGWNITVFADGAGYPKGQGTVSKGEQLFQAQCAACHGLKLEGGLGPALAGGKGTLASKKPLKTVGSYWPYASTLFEYIRRAMPFQAPQSLSNDDVYSLAGYILHINEILPADAHVDAAVLTAVRMPNRNGFYVDNRPDTRATRCMKNCPAMPLGE